MTVLRLKKDFTICYESLDDLTKQISLATDLKAFSIKDMTIMTQIVDNPHIREVTLYLISANRDYTNKTVDMIYGTKLVFEHAIDEKYTLYGEYDWREQQNDKYSPNFQPETFRFLIDKTDARTNTQENGPTLFVSNIIEGPFNSTIYDYSEYITEKAMQKWKDMSSREEDKHD